MVRNNNLAYEAADAAPPLTTLGVAAQGAVITISNIVMITTVFAVAIRADADYLSWAVFASLVVSGSRLSFMGFVSGGWERVIYRYRERRLHFWRYRYWLPFRAAWP